MKSKKGRFIDCLLLQEFVCLCIRLWDSLCGASCGSGFRVCSLNPPLAMIRAATEDDIVAVRKVAEGWVRNPTCPKDPKS